MSRESASTVSVQIVTYNSAEWIVACLEAVFRQSYPIEHVIIVDNASTDHTRLLIEPYSDRVKEIANQINRGFAGGHNQAMQVADCDYYVVLNPDVVLHEDYVLHIVQHLDQHLQTGSATGMLVRSANPELIDSTGLTMHRNRRCFDRGANQAAEAWREPAEIFGVSGAAAVYARTFIEHISIDGQFFDEHFFAYKEDVDVAWRGQLLGWSAAYIPQSLAQHERGWKEGERSQRPLFVRQHSYINRYRMMIKNERLPYILRHFFPLLVFEGASLLYYAVKDPKVFLSWGKLWQDRQRLWRHRKLIAGRRKKSVHEVYHFFQ